MARLLFIQLNEYELHGPQSIAAVASARGHTCGLIIPFLERNPLPRIREFAPDVVGFSLTTVERKEALCWARVVKKATGAKVVFGGVDPTFFPQVIEHDGVDAVCRGEGEYALTEYLDRIDQEADLRGIQGLWVKKDGQLGEGEERISCNPVRPLIEDLDSLPFPMKGLYFDHYSHFRRYPIKFFMASRGCPHGCTYCANRGLREMYPNPEHYVRFKSPGYLLEEMEQVLRHHRARVIGFNDDLFTYKTEWLAEFLEGYKKRFGLPFFCCARIDTMTEEKARLLKEAGCYTCWYGLESANPRTREEVLGRRISDQAIERGTQILHQAGILTQSYNMFNIPGQTLEDGLETLRMNIRLRNDYVVGSLFQPFPGTELARRLIERGELRAEQEASRENISYFSFTPYKQKDTEALVNLQKLFIIGHWFPFLVPRLGRLCRLPRNPLFDILFLISFAIDYGRAHRLSLWEVARYNTRHLFTTYLRGHRPVPEVKEECG